MKVALVGSSGYIAEFLVKRFEAEERVEQVLKIDQTDDADVVLNLLEPERFDYSTLDNIDYIVFTAAISGPDKCALDFEWCWSINVAGTSYFIKQALNRKCRVLFFSSDAVFGNVADKIYVEDSETQAITPYGKMKKAIEDEFKNNSNFKVIRLSYVVSAKDRFVSYCLKCVESNDVADVFHPFYRNCIVVDDVVETVMWFLLHWDEYGYFALNVAGKELVSRVRIADELNRLLNGKLQYNISSPPESFYENRPRITQMESLYMKEYKILEDCSFTEKFFKQVKEFILL